MGQISSEAQQKSAIFCYHYSCYLASSFLVWISKLNGHYRPLSRHCPYTFMITMATLFSALPSITVPLKHQVLFYTNPNFHNWSCFYLSLFFVCWYICLLIVWLVNMRFVIQSLMLQRRWSIRIFRMTRISLLSSTALIKGKRK